MCEGDGEIDGNDGASGVIDENYGDFDDDESDVVDVAHRGIGHASLYRLKIKQLLGRRAVLQHLHHLLQHRQVHRLDHLHGSLHLLHFVQDFVTFCPRTLFVYVPSIRSDLLIDVCDVAEIGHS